MNRLSGLPVFWAVASRRNPTFSLPAWIFALVFTVSLWGQDTPTAEGPVGGDAGAPLEQRQSQIGDRFSRFETLLLRLADVESSENPERAALLRRASRQAREGFILERIEGATDAIGDGRFAQAIKDQKSAQEALSALLQLLQSEDRQSRIREEKERIRQLINDLNRLERAQRSTRAQTEGGTDLEQAAEQQKDIEERAQKLADRLKEEAKDGEPKPDSNRNDPNDKPGTDPEQDPSNKEPPSEGDKPDEPNESKPEGEPNQPNESKPSSENNPPQGQPQPNSPTDQPQGENPSKPGESPSPPDANSPSQPQTPQQAAAQELQQAQEAMRQAQKALDESKRKDAAEPQRRAEAKLREAAERLERILKQLREEEIERQLTKLESRLKEIAQRQTKVLESTRDLAATPESQRDRQTDVLASNLAFDEKKIAADTDRALLLLAEDGSGRAFPEVLSEVRDDMFRVSTRLGQTQLDPVTIGLQEDILAALDEMIKALQQEQRKREEQKQQEGNQPQNQGQQQEDPLVDAIAELRLIKTQEIRIKSSTERYSNIARQSAPDSDLQKLLMELADRQVRLYRVVRDIVTEQQQK